MLAPRSLIPLETIVGSQNICTRLADVPGVTGPMGDVQFGGTARGWGRYPEISQAAQGGHLTLCSYECLQDCDGLKIICCWVAGAQHWETRDVEG